MLSKFDAGRRTTTTAMGAGGAMLATPLADAAIAAPVRKLGTAAGRITIKSVTTFDVLIPQPASAAAEPSVAALPAASMSPASKPTAACAEKPTLFLTEQGVGYRLRAAD